MRPRRPHVPEKRPPSEVPDARALVGGEGQTRHRSATRHRLDRGCARLRPRPSPKRSCSRLRVLAVRAEGERIDRVAQADRFSYRRHVASSQNVTSADPPAERVASARVVPSGLSAMPVKTSPASPFTPNGSPLPSPLGRPTGRLPRNGSRWPASAVGGERQAHHKRRRGERLAHRSPGGRIMKLKVADSRACRHRRPPALPRGAH